MNDFMVVKLFSIARMFKDVDNSGKTLWIFGI